MKVEFTTVQVDKVNRQRNWIFESNNHAFNHCPAYTNKIVQSEYLRFEQRHNLKKIKTATVKSIFL